MQQATQVLTITKKILLERLDDVLIAEMITQRFHGPFIHAKKLHQRVDELAASKKK